MINKSRKEERMRKIVIITGPPGSGKTTVGNILAKKIKNSALISTDDLRHMIKNGIAEIEDSKWEEQLKLGVKNTILLAKNFYKSGFNVFLEDILLDDKFDLYCNALKKYDLKIFLLMPEKKVLAKRDLERGEWAMKERAIRLHGLFENFSKKEKRFTLIDSSNQTPEQTANEIIEVIGGKK